MKIELNDAKYQRELAVAYGEASAYGSKIFLVGVARHSVFRLHCEYSKKSRGDTT